MAAVVAAAGDRSIERTGNLGDEMEEEEEGVHTCIFQILGTPDSERRARPRMASTAAHSRTDGRTATVWREGNS